MVGIAALVIVIESLALMAVVQFIACVWCSALKFSIYCCAFGGPRAHEWSRKWPITHTHKSLAIPAIQCANTPGSLLNGRATGTVIGPLWVVLFCAAKYPQPGLQPDLQLLAHSISILLNW